jgi:hypothetical protein
MIFSEGCFMKVELFEYNLQHESLLTFEDDFNAFSQNVEVIDVKPTFTNTQAGLFLFVVVLYK